MNKREKTKQLLEQLVESVKSRYKQEFKGEQEEFMDRVLRTHRGKIARVSWRASQKWCKWTKEGPVLFPDSTRIYYRKGDTEILLQEFAPQTRFLKFTGSLAARGSSIEEISETAMEEVHRYSLPLPYTVFIFKFIKGKFHEVKVAFCDRPLRRLKERPLRPYFSNIDTTLKVCLGHSFNEDELITGDLVQQASYVVGYFWQSIFRDEWASHYWDNKHHFEQLEDHRMSTLEKWQETGFNDPLFVIDDVQWMAFEEDTFGDIIVNMLHTDAVNQDFSEELYLEFIEEFLEDVQQTLDENVEAAGDKLSVPNLDDIVDELLSL